MKATTNISRRNFMGAGAAVLTAAVLWPRLSVGDGSVYLGSVGRNAKLEIGLTPNLDGLMDETDVARCKEFGEWLGKTLGGKPVAETAGVGATVELRLPAPTRIANVVVMENVAMGERIQNYTLSGQLPGGSWQELGRGQCVGHKRIEQIPAVEITAVRLVVDKYKAEPQLQKLAVYSEV